MPSKDQSHATHMTRVDNSCFPCTAPCKPEVMQNAVPGILSLQVFFPCDGGNAATCTIIIAPVGFSSAVSCATGQRITVNDTTAVAGITYTYTITIDNGLALSTISSTATSKWYLKLPCPLGSIVSCSLRRSWIFSCRLELTVDLQFPKYRRSRYRLFLLTNMFAAVVEF